MAAYDRHEVRERDRDRDRDRHRRYPREEYYEERETRYVDDRHGHPLSRDLVPRAREESDLDVEEIRRDFPPPSGRDIRRARSADPVYEEYDVGYRRRYERDDDFRGNSRKGFVAFDDDDHGVEALDRKKLMLAALATGTLAVGMKELWDRRESNGKDVKRNYLASTALGVAGALTGFKAAEMYGKQRTEKERKKMSVRADSRGLIEGGGRNRDGEPYPEKDGEKNFLDKVLAGSGLAAVLSSLTGKKPDEVGGRDGRDRGHSESHHKKQTAAKAGLVAGAAEAFRIAKEPGGWKGEKMKRVLTSVVGATVIDKAKAKHDPKESFGGLLQSVLGGLIGNRIINGPKKNIEEDEVTGRSRSRSRAARDKSGGSSGMGGLAALATAGLGALGAKKLYDHNKDESPDRSRSRRRRNSDSDADEPKRRDRSRSRSRSVVDTARRSLARLGIGNGPDEDRQDDRRRDHDDFDNPRSSSRRRPYSDDEDDDDYDRPRRRDHQRSQSRSRRARSAGDDSDLGDSSGDERTAKKMKGKQILTTSLAAVATIHAAHEVYESVEKRQERKKAVRQGRLTPGEAEKLKSKALLEDAVSVGIAALGIKSAIGSCQSARKSVAALKEFREQKQLRHQRRLKRQTALGSSGDATRRADSWDTAAAASASRHDYVSDRDEPYSRPANYYRSSSR